MGSGRTKFLSVSYCEKGNMSPTVAVILTSVVLGTIALTDAPALTKRDVPSLDNCLHSENGRCVCCKEGWRKGSVNCDISCPDCIYSYSKGVCVADCKGGSWGEECHLKCPPNCIRSSHNGKSMCKKTSGICRGGCIQGYYGEKCNSNCSHDCTGRFCYWGNGTCFKCSDKSYGSYCQHPCSDGCIEGKCSRDGSCTCKEDWLGRRCEKKCSKFCKSKECSINVQGQLECKGDCINGNHGIYCTIPCPNQCSICDKRTGLCLETQYGMAHVNSATLKSIEWYLKWILVAILIAIVAGCFQKYKVKNWLQKGYVWVMRKVFQRTQRPEQSHPSERKVLYKSGSSNQGDIEDGSVRVERNDGSLHENDTENDSIKEEANYPTQIAEHDLHAVYGDNDIRETYTRHKTTE